MTYLTGKFITESGLQAIKDHKYKSGGYSFVDNLMNKYWEWSVSLVPMTVAPNTLTLIGLLFNLVFYGIMAFYDTSMS